MLANALHVSINAMTLYQWGLRCLKQQRFVHRPSISTRHRENVNKA